MMPSLFAAVLATALVGLSSANNDAAAWFVTPAPPVVCNDLPRRSDLALSIGRMGALLGAVGDCVTADGMTV